MERIDAICDLLVAAAHADGRYGDRERSVIGEMMRGITQSETLEPKLAARIAFGNSENIDVDAIVAYFENDPPETRRLLMQLIVAVVEADDLYDIDEDEFVIFVAGALGFNTDEIQEFALDVQVNNVTMDLSLKELGELEASALAETPED